MKWPKINRAISILIVFAVAAVVIAVILPNMSGSRGRGSRVTRGQSDMRSLATGIEAFYLDNGAYPPMQPLMETASDREVVRKKGGAYVSIPYSGGALGNGLTTPVAFISYLFPDPFSPTKGTFAYYKDQGGWILISPGPDRVYDIRHPEEVYDSKLKQPSPLLITFAYDSTNGTESGGDVFRVKPMEDNIINSVATE